MNLFSRLLAASLLLTSACTKKPSAPEPTPPGPAAATGGERIACSFWARTGSGPMSEAPTVLEVGETAESLSLAGFDIEASLSPSDDGGRTLRVNTRVNDTAVDSVFDFGAQLAPAHLPAGGHGFTGLRYLTAPETGNELQYACGAYAEGVDVGDELASQSAPGAGVAAQNVSCELVLTDAEGAELGRETFTLAPGDTEEAFALSVRYIEPGAESGGVVIDAAPTLHTLYQLTEPGLPANTLAGPSFTGTHALERDGQVVRHRCWSDG